jgi:AraC-like DNA-binding protein
MNIANPNPLKHMVTHQTINPNEKNLHLQIPATHAGPIVAWLVEQSIPFDLAFSEPNPSPVAPIPTLAHAQPHQSKKAGDGDEVTLTVIEKVYKKYITDQLEIAPPKMEEIAAELSMSAQTFKKKFFARYGKPFYQLYMEKRMEYAAKLLKQGYKCREVSERIGYGENSDIKFNKMFQKHFGITPKKYQMAHFRKR